MASVSAMKTKVLIIDDDAAIRQQLYWSLIDDYDVMTAEDMPSAISASRSAPHVSLLDLQLTPAEIRSVLFEVARGQLDERAARPAIRALNRIMRDARPPLTPATERRN